IGILEQIRNRVVDEHLIPDADAHRRAFLGIHRLAAQISLVEAQIQFITFAEKMDDDRLRPKFGKKKMQPGFVQNRDDLAEQHVNLATAFVDNGVNAEKSRECQKHRHQNRATSQSRKKGDDEADETHDFSSMMTCCALL